MLQEQTLTGCPCGYTLAEGTSLHPHPESAREVLPPPLTELHMEPQRGK